MIFLLPFYGSSSSSLFECSFFSFCQLAFPDAIYLVDAIQGGEMLIKACKPALESSHITKVIHDCKRDSEVFIASQHVTSCSKEVEDYCLY